MMMMIMVMTMMMARIVKMYLLSKLIHQMQHVCFMSGVDTDDDDDNDDDEDEDDDGENSEDVPAVQTHTSDAACLVHIWC